MPYPHVTTHRWTGRPPRCGPPNMPFPRNRVCESNESESHIESHHSRRRGRPCRDRRRIRAPQILLRSHADDSESDDEAPVASVITVQVSALELKTLHHYVTGYGSVTAAPATANEPAASAAVAAPVSGVVTAVNVAPGQQVRRGQMLVALNSQSMTESYAERELARQKMLYAQHNGVHGRHGQRPSGRAV